jgi:hypothetical protein
VAACTEPEPPFPLARFLVQSAAWAPAIAAFAANRLAEIPLPF